MSDDEKGSSQSGHPPPSPAKGSHSGPPPPPHASLCQAGPPPPPTCSASMLSPPVPPPSPASVPGSHNSRSLSPMPPAHDTLLGVNVENLDSVMARKHSHEQEAELGKIKSQRLSKSVQDPEFIAKMDDMYAYSIKQRRKLKKLLGITDQQLLEFRAYQRNQAILFKKFGPFVDMRMAGNDVVLQRPGDPPTYFRVSAQDLPPTKVYNLEPRPEDTADMSSSDRKVAKVLGITKQQLELFREYEKNREKLSQTLGRFVQIDDPAMLAKMDRIEVLMQEDVDRRTK